MPRAGPEGPRVAAGVYSPGLAKHYHEPPAHRPFVSNDRGARRAGCPVHGVLNDHRISTFYGAGYHRH